MALLALLLASLLLCDQVMAYWLFESLNVTQWQWQSSVVVDNWLYIDGGELYALRNGNPTFFYLGQTISIDLSKSWTNSTVQQYAKEKQRSTTDGHWSKKPSLFYDTSKNRVIQWGGWPYDNGDVSYEFSFIPSGTGEVSWSKSDTPITNSQDSNNPSPAVFGAAFVASNTSFYSLGGIVAEESAPPDTAIQGLVEYDYATDQWTNSSSVNATSNGYLVGAEASLTPSSDQGGFGAAGFLIFLGGNNPDTQLFDLQTPSLANLSTITLYDVSKKQWYHQTTTGDIPPPRQFFCSVAATSIQATFEMFILGGSTNTTFDQNNANDTDYLNVYTLSIPAFRWFKSTDSDQVRRADHSCQLIGNKQMLVIGGTQPSNPLGIAAVDPWPNGMGIFDMSAFTWSDSYDPQAAPYQQPETVRNYYSYDYQAPAWNSPDLEAAFAWAPPDLPTGTYTGSYPSSTASSSGTNASPTSSYGNPSNSSGTSHTGAIVGGVVGGIGGLLLIGLIIFFIRKRKPDSDQKNRQSDSKPDRDSSVIPKHELPLSSPSSAGFNRHLEDEKKFEDERVELESPEPTPRPELADHSIPRKPVPAEMP